MQKTAIKVNTIEALSWPERCPHCGHDLKEGNIMAFELKIRKGFKAMLAAGFGSKNIPVRLCIPCAKKITNFRTIEAVGGIIMFVAIIGPFLLKRFYTMQSMLLI